ncbi:MAG: bacillithiol biosynthesis cysteine-adding enzyme BshC [Williamsia sp.]|nr:bacillithiol biosynthesis cysteine-adding enzyme BshC [Williamsia sp.]
MDCTAISIPYRQTGYFTSIINDYIEQAPALQPFYEHPVSWEGIRESIRQRQAFHTDRAMLVQVLHEQYASVPAGERVQDNINKLLNENTFTLVTAHQPHIFTGHLYFIYKIVHVIKLADILNRELPDSNFVPVFYMGSEDADLDELGKIYLGGEEVKWTTTQQGAVGRMNNKGLDKIIDRLEGELAVQPHGPELIALLRECYSASSTVQAATFRLINRLFERYGLLVLIPDHPKLKAAMHPVFKDDLLSQTPSFIVEKTIEQLSAHYKVQATPREINLFYLKDGLRERIVKLGEEYRVVGTGIHFTEQALLEELQNHPDRFSPNVILRGLFQETILPNIAFIGGGGETAYWLELKELFHHYQVPFPVLVLRNSFLFIEKKWKERAKKLGIDSSLLFKEERLITNEIVKRDSQVQLQLEGEIGELEHLYARIQGIAGKIDSTLSKHVTTLQVRAEERLYRLEKKMLQAEKRKFSDQQNQVQSLKRALFPRNGLQERIDNFSPYFARWGDDFISMIYEHTPLLEQVFTVVEED